MMVGFAVSSPRCLSSIFQEANQRIISCFHSIELSERGAASLLLFMAKLMARRPDANHPTTACPSLLATAARGASTDWPRRLQQCGPFDGGDCSIISGPIKEGP